MTVVELVSPSRDAVTWTEVCASDHVVETARGRGPSATAGRSLRARPASAPGAGRRGASVGPGRRVSARPLPRARAQACDVAAPSLGGVVDDVPAWALLLCGVAFALLMLVALAVAGPAYA